MTLAKLKLAQTVLYRLPHPALFLCCDEERDVIEDGLPIWPGDRLNQVVVAFGSWSLSAVRWLLRDKGFGYGLDRQKRIADLLNDLTETDIERLFKAIDQTNSGRTDNPPAKSAAACVMVCRIRSMSV